MDAKGQPTGSYNLNDTMKMFTNPEQFFTSAKNMSSADFGSYTNKMKKNTDIIAQAGKLCAHNAQNALKQYAEAAHKHTTETYNTLKNMFSAQSIEEAASLHRQYVQNSVENAMNHAKEIVDLTTNTATTVAQLYTDQMNCFANKGERSCNSQE
jgi:phasin family protein